MYILTFKHESLSLSFSHFIILLNSLQPNEQQMLESTRHCQPSIDLNIRNTTINYRIPIQYLSVQMKKRKRTPRQSKAIEIATDSTTKTTSRKGPSFNLREKDEKESASSISGTALNKHSILSYYFYQIDALDLAPRLLGKYLKKDDVVLQITEVEAYRPNDSACHGRFGITARTAPVFGPGGHAYVYLCYGLHSMLNVVADKEGIGAAVLVRSCSPVSGLETIQQRRGLISDKPVLLTGPGKVGQALGLSTSWSNHPLFAPGGLELIDGPEPEKILVGPRVGINYALPEHVSAPWRFAIAGSLWISAPRNTLRPA